MSIDRPPRFGRGRAALSPQAIHAVGVEDDIIRNEPHPLDQGRCRDEAVERVPVMKREGRQRLDVVGLDRQEMNVIRQQGGRVESAERSGQRQRQLAETILEGDFQQGDGRQPSLIRWILDRGPRRTAELWIVGLKPQQRMRVDARVSFHVLSHLFERLLDVLGHDESALEPAGLRHATPVTGGRGRLEASV